MDYINYEECISSSGCESGWTLYLEEEHSSTSPYNISTCNNNHQHDHTVFTQSNRLKQHHDYKDEDEDEDEDESMVSDASSGPPHLHEQEQGNDVINGSFYQRAATVHTLSSSRKKNRSDINGLRHKNHSSTLDDTASSPFFFDFSHKSLSTTRSQASADENVLEYSQGYSSTHINNNIQVRPPYQEHCDFFQSSQPEINLLQQNHRWFEGKMW